MADNQHNDKNLRSTSPQSDTVKEDNTIVTPYAFQVAPELLGEPLATPARRGIAQCIDLILIYYISHANGLVLGALAALTFMRAGNNVIKGKGKTSRGKMLRLAAACLLGYIVYTTFDGPPQISGYPATQTRNAGDSIEEEGFSEQDLRPALVGVSTLIWKSCDDDFDCLKEVTEGFIEVQADLGAELSELKVIQSRFLDKSTLSEEQKATLVTLAETTFQLSAERLAQEQAEQAAASQSTPSAEGTEGEETDKPADESGSGAGFFATLTELLHDGQAFLSELGLGLGWAALYYSAFTAYMQGCTPGKWITRIRVLRLDGRPPTLWESFGRYGGYGAGFATGMLGFLQIYWDANRQSIQDKIAETLVVTRSVKVLPKPTESGTAGTSGEGI